MAFELFRCDTHFIFVKEKDSLWWDKNSGECSVKSDWEWVSANNLECLGIFYGIIGKIDQTSFMESRIMLIKDVCNVGELYGNHIIYQIKSVAFLELGSKNVNINLLPCKKHRDMNNKSLGGALDDSQKTGFAKTWGTIKSATNTIKSTTQQAATLATSQVKSTMIRRSGKDKEKLEKRLLEELSKIFSETGSFFFCHTGDITNSLQRQNNYTELQSGKSKRPLWQTVDDRFFWNKNMLRDIINLNTELADPWILPIIQGYVQIEKCKVETGYDQQPIYEIFHLAIISRRSRFRAGTRYKRRGVDDDGKCANYVETEQLIWYHDHQVSFVQVRGSVPVYWSQPGYKYKPPPRIDKDESETQIAFEKHFAEETACYGPICIVNLIEQSGKEKIIWDAYSDHVIKYNSPDIIYTTFDFHEYCRGMHFENVTILVNALSDVLGEMGYCWRDSQGSICSQKGVFRINCMDCLDRTNVVQTALAKTVMEMQFSKLGLIPPDGSLPSNIRQTFQSLWANNGDIISKQYAGTNALKGDYTRTGERKITGLMKDGVNSANRYYLNRFKDVYRQAGIDLMLGKSVSEEIFQERTEEEDNVATALHVKLLIEDCKKLLVSNPEAVLGSWGLIDADPVTGNPSETEMDTILILTKDNYYIADYDDQIDKVTNYQQVLLSEIEMIEFGQPEISASFFKNKQHHFIRINYRLNNESGYFHMFRSTNLRFFNNMAVVIKTDEEALESMKAICEAFSVAIEIAALPEIPIVMNTSLTKKISKQVETKESTGLLDISSFPQLTRNISETQLHALKNAGTKAFNNMSEQFSKLNKLSNSFSGSKKLPSNQAEKKSSNDKVEQNIQSKIVFTIAKCESAIEAENFDFDNNSYDGSSCDSPSFELTRREKNVDGDKIGSKQENFEGENIKAGNPSNPTITIQNTDAQEKDEKEKIVPPSTLNLVKNISHSSSEVDGKTNTYNLIEVDQSDERKHSSLSEDLPKNNITSSQSESAIKSIKSNITNATSPVANTAKEILSPFSKFAKGVQTFGANFDPRKLKSNQGTVTKTLSDHYLDQREKLIERWKGCKSMLIAL
ncbi:phosphatidylinositide phosphatase SAC2 isoform X2 [Microplitis demolitor]|uniref:phosphatidylinositide phosphatase SAC2 isoform X2 n=1 Tax=Microplitis demolitor TaxID=69319 RepID=UPI0004CDC917|nr:phosphatidylinositide phosphatase SAC2 isoform X2 [Microplitis demolitor]